jgi:oxalate decarboxylase
MSHLQRREFLAAAGLAAAATATLMGPSPAEAGDPRFMNNVLDPVLAEDELPTFKFELEKSKGKVIGNSYGKEATVKQLPISKGIAGVSMKIEPGALRELHWHPNADEWQYVIEGRVSVTLFGANGRYRTETLDTGKSATFPRATATRLRTSAGRAAGS